MKKYWLIALVSVCAVFSAVAQQNTVAFADVGFEGITDSLIKQEVAAFTEKGSMLRASADWRPARLTELPVKSCNDQMVYLSKGDIYVHFYFKKNEPGRVLDSIFLVTHSHFLVRFPRAAFEGLGPAAPCDFKGGKRASFSSPYFKAFRSADTGRLYLYMKGGTGNEKYEVTWVIYSKFYLRIIDRDL